MILEILAISITNYFTSSPELIRPTHLQLNQVKNLLNYVQYSFMNIIELILNKLPSEILQNNWANQLQSLLKTKKAKR